MSTTYFTNLVSKYYPQHPFYMKVLPAFKKSKYLTSMNNVMADVSNHSNSKYSGNSLCFALVPFCTIVIHCHLRLYNKTLNHCLDKFLVIISTEFCSSIYWFIRKFDQRIMADSDRQELITQFTDVTGVSADRAQFYLESANWTLQVHIILCDEMNSIYCNRAYISNALCFQI